MVNPGKCYCSVLQTLRCKLTMHEFVATNSHILVPMYSLSSKAAVGSATQVLTKSIHVTQANMNEYVLSSMCAH